MLRPYFAGNTYVLYIPAQNTPTNQAFKLERVEFNNNGAADRWLMVFSGVAIPADGATPLMGSILAQANFSGIESFIPDGLIAPAPGIVIVASSTKTTLTKDATATIDITGFVEEFEIPQPGTSVAGDYTTGVNHLQVWTEANGPKFLYKLELTNAALVTEYAVIYATDAMGASDKPQAILPIPPQVGGINGQAVYSFGNVTGFSPFQQDANGTKHTGCQIKFSPNTTPGTVTPGVPITAKATYK